MTIVKQNITGIALIFSFIKFLYDKMIVVKQNIMAFLPTEMQKQIDNLNLEKEDMILQHKKNIEYMRSEIYNICQNNNNKLPNRGVPAEIRELMNFVRLHLNQRIKEKEDIIAYMESDIYQYWLDINIS
jgi:hypothetical protein